MHSVGVIASMLAGCALGILILGRYPHGLDPTAGWVLIACACLLVVPAYLARGSKSLRWACVFAMAAIAGCGWALRTYPPVGPGDLAYYNGPEKGPTVTLTGMVSAEPSLSDKSQRVRVEVSEGRLGGSNYAVMVKGSLLAFLPRYPGYSVGDRLSLTGSLTDPPLVEGFDYPAYLARAGVRSYMFLPKVKVLGPGETSLFAREISHLRDEARAALKASIAEPMASLATGVVIGDRSSMPDALQQDFLISGTVHVLAISGQNLSLLVGFVFVLYSRGRNRGRLPRWLAAVAIAGLAFYTAYTGATPSVVRAAIMAAILLLGPLLGRRYDPLAALAVSAGAMTLLDPDILGDAGFQLSFGAMLGIALVSPHLSYLFSKLRLWDRAVLPNWLAAALATGVGAQVVTLPVSLALSGRVSLVSPLATLCIDASLLPLMIAGIATVLCYPLAPTLAALPGAVAWFCGEWMAWWVHFWASLPGASISVSELEPGWVAVYYILACAAILVLSKRLVFRTLVRKTARRPAAALVLCLALWAAAAWFLLRG